MYEWRIGEKGKNKHVW